MFRVHLEAIKANSYLSLRMKRSKGKILSIGLNLEGNLPEEVG